MPETRIANFRHFEDFIDTALEAICSALGFVAETLLVAILLHALLALVLVDFCFTAFLDGAHGFCWLCYGEKN